MANRVFDWPAAWPGNGEARLLTVARSGGRGLALAHHAGAPALLRKATLGADAAHPVRLWDIGDTEAVVPDSVEILYNWQDAPGPQNTVAARVALVRAWLEAQGVEAGGVTEEGVAEDAPAFTGWLTDEGGLIGVKIHRNEIGNQEGPSANFGFGGVPIDGSYGRWAPGVVQRPLAWRTVGFPTVAAGCSMRLRFHGRFRADIRYPSGGWGSGGYPNIAMRAEVCAVGVSPMGVWPGRVALTPLVSEDFAVALHRYADYGGAWDTTTTDLDTAFSCELTFSVPESRVILFRVRLANPIQTAADFFSAMPFDESEGSYLVRAVRPDDSETNGFTLAPVAP